MSSNDTNLFRVRTVTAFISLHASDFPSSVDTLEESPLANKVAQASQLLQTVQSQVAQAGYTVQTVRLATNPFGVWLVDGNEHHEKQLTADDVNSTALLRLNWLCLLLKEFAIEFCALGPAESISELKHLCPKIVAYHPALSCSANIAAANFDSAHVAALVIQEIAQLPHLKGLGNFRFCATAASCKPYIPFFPAAKAETLTNEKENDTSDGVTIGFALGLENGALARHLLQETITIAHVQNDFCSGMADALKPLQDICRQVEADQESSHSQSHSHSHSHNQKFYKYKYWGIDSSLNPSLDDEGGSVAEAIEQLAEVTTFGGPGTIGAAAAITMALQSLPGIQLVGYCGLMLPVCEDRRLAALASVKATDNSSTGDVPLRIADLLSISSVCGVGIDTVPLPGDVPVERLTALLLDMAGLAARWDKSLSCRVLPFDGKHVGDMTNFDSPYMVNAQVFQL